MINFYGLATVSLRLNDREELWIGDVSWAHGTELSIEAPAALVIKALGEEKLIAVAQPDVSVPDLWTGETWPGSVEFLVRPTIEDDAISAVSMASVPAIPMPLDVIEGIIRSEGIFSMPTLYAMSEDDGFVATMMLDSDQGLYVRYSSMWHLLTDDNVVDGLNATEVSAAALDMFDQFDRAGQLVNVGSMQTPEGEEAGVDVLGLGATPGGAPEGLVATVATLEVPHFESAEDLPAVLQAAVENPELRWWAERRMKALGLDAEVPW